MNTELINNMLINAIFLIGLAVVYSFLPKTNAKYKYLIQIVIGLILGYFIIALMRLSSELSPDTFIDTKSILVSLTAMFFGFIPGIIIILAGTLYRIFVIGGDGALTGTLIFITSGMIGMIFHKYRFKYLSISFWRRINEFFGFGFLVHLTVYLLLIIFPVSRIADDTPLLALQLLLIYPFISTIVSYLMYFTYDSFTKTANIIQSQEKFVRAVEDAPVPIAIHSGNGKVIKFNKEWTKATGYNLHNSANIQIWAEKAFKENAIQALEEIDKLTELDDEIYRNEIRFYTSKNRKVTWDFHVSVIGTQPDNSKLIMSIANDITEQKKLEKELISLSFKDKLTNLYNRRFFEEELERLNVKRNYPLSIIFADVNSLKLTNDAFGHNEGDKLLKTAAKVFRKAFRADDIIARVGGDEFVIILPRTDEETTGILIDRVREQIKGNKIKNIQVSLAMGSYTSTTLKLDINRVFALAEENMYQNKLSMNKKVKENAINVIINTLFRADPSSKAHALEVAELCEKVGNALDMDDSSIAILKKAGYLHDIGKIVIPKSILKKKTQLDEIERIEMKKHPETGYRILNNGYNLTNYASIILDHHERWDGSGYPQKKRGKDISIESRIISICDAFRTMTSISTYRANRLNTQQAVDELVRQKGSHFDPALVDLFVENVIKEL